MPSNTGGWRLSTKATLLPAHARENKLETFLLQTTMLPKAISLLSRVYKYSRTESFDCSTERFGNSISASVLSGRRMGQTVTIVVDVIFEIPASLATANLPTGTVDCNVDRNVDCKTDKTEQTRVLAAAGTCFEHKIASCGLKCSLYTTKVTSLLPDHVILGVGSQHSNMRLTGNFSVSRHAI